MNPEQEVSNSVIVRRLTKEYGSVKAIDNVSFRIGKGEIVGRTAGQLATTKDNGDIDAITASTITTRSFLRAVNNAYAEYAKVVTPHAEADVHTSATAKDMN